MDSTQSYYDGIVDQYDDMVFPDYDCMVNSKQALEQYKQNLDSFFDMYQQFLREDLEALDREMQKNTIRKFRNIEFCNRIEIIDNFLSGLDDIAKLFNESIIHPPLYDCWFCRQKSDKVIKCVNNHNDFLCWNCAFSYIKQGTPGSFKCGICMEKLKVNKNTLLDSTPNQLKIIYPKISIKCEFADMRFYRDLELFNSIKSIHPDFAFIYWIEFILGDYVW